MYPSFTDKKFSGEVIEKSPLSFNHDLVLYHFKNSNSDFEFLHKIKKVTKVSGSMPFPVLPALMDILGQRLES